MKRKKTAINRRQFLQTSAGVALAGSVINSQTALSATPENNANNRIIKVAGYDYDRVLAICVFC